MFSTMRTAPPRIGCRMSPGRIVGRATALERSRSAGAWASCRTSVCNGAPGVVAGSCLGRGASLTMTVTGDFSDSGARPVALSKYVRQLGSTLARSPRYISRRSRAKT